MYDVTLKQDGIYFAYLRKSREDRDAENNGAGDTLARHQYILQDYAERNSIKISRWYKEVVSGETITDRPEMTKLLHDVETIQPDGVLVVEVERLSRGNPQDQGRVMDTFKYSNSLIITPLKIYDLNRENDEEWMDFGLLRSRMEYRTIKRRLQNGRTTSAMQGKYIGNVAPYGWQRKKLKGEKGFTLEPDPETAWVLMLMYTLMDTGNESTDFLPVGTTRIGQILDESGIKPPKGSLWDPGVIGRILSNPANIGIVRIGWRKQVSVLENGEKKKSRPINTNHVTVPARWAGQISPEQYHRVCAKMKSNTYIHSARPVKNPMAGLIICSACGRPMQRRPKGAHTLADTLICKTPGCPTVASYCDLVEERLISSLEVYLENYKININGNTGIDWISSIEIKEALLAEHEKNMETLQKQLSKIHVCFEQDIYDMDTFLSRSREVKNEIENYKIAIAQIKHDLAGMKDSYENRETFIPKMEGILDSYKKSKDPAYKNALLKELISKVDYTKTFRSLIPGESNEKFELDIHMKVRPL